MNNNHAFQSSKFLRALLVLFFMTVSVQWTFAQLNLNVSRTTLGTVIEQIKSQSKYQFFYDDKLATMAVENVKVKNASIEDALNAILKGKNISFKVEDNIIYLSEKSSAPQEGNQQGKEHTITGQVSDDMGPLIGVNVLVKGTSVGCITDIDGNFTLTTTEANPVVQFSYVGYKPQEIAAKGQRTINVMMLADSQLIEEVVVTALGIKRSEKALSYNVQQVNADDITKNKDVNFVNSLNGKVAGVNINASSSGVGGVSKVVMRGTKSIMQTSNALYVIDGVPVLSGRSNKAGGTEFDSQGSTEPIADINPEDIESMSVLKGASAAALYGSRAGNGVILITTKKGTKREGLGITISGSVSAETIFMNPKMQKSFGQGDNGAYNTETSNSWGPAMGSEYTFNGQKRVMQYYDNVDAFFKTGLNLTESISFSQQYDKTSIYASLNRMDDSSKIPGATLDRTNLTLRAFYTFGKDDRWSLDAKVQYINTNADNRPMTGSNDQNMFRTIYQLPSSMDIRDYSNPLTDEGKINWYNNSGMNPYWAELYNTNHDTRNRFLMNASLKYKFTDWLNAEIKAGSDMYNTESNNKLYAGSNRNNGNSQYSLEEKKFYENNFSFLISAQKDHLIDKFGGTMTFGGNLMERKTTGLKGDATKLTVPNLFNLLNSSKNDRNFKETYNHKKINSLYGTLGINYDGWVFLDATFRNDWSSALNKENRSFFYPSVSLSWVISDMVGKVGKGMPEWFTYAKARASFAQVGNDMDAYQLYNTYSIGSDPNGNTTAGQGKTKYDADVRSELITSWEAGAELKFFNNRLGVDFAWYKTNAKRQLMNIPLNNLSGYDNMKVNAGNIQNTGIEIMLNARPIETTQFSWDTQLNFSQNKSKIIELLPGKPGMQYALGGSDALQVYAVAGGAYGEIWGTKYQRVEEGEFKGQLLLNESGLPQATSDKHKIGEQQPDFLLGWTNTFNYKNFTLSFLIDGRFGGDIFSFTNMNLQRSGISECTAPGGKREDIVVAGVIKDGNGYKVNDQSVSLERYYKALATGRAGISEAYIYDATNIRLRNIALSYRFPSSMLKKTPFQQVKLGFTVNNVWMISSHLDGIDPESVYATSTNATGLENSSAPTSRSYLFNVTLGF